MLLWLTRLARVACTRTKVQAEVRSAQAPSRLARARGRHFPMCP